jgi:hypothetical protein
MRHPRYLVRSNYVEPCCRAANLRRRSRRGLAILAGVTAMGAGAALNVTHLVDGGQPLVSPMTGAVLALALGAVAAALVAGEAWRSGRTTLAFCLVLSIVAGEGFGLIMGAERLLTAREERQRAASEVNTSRWVATVRVETASATLAATEAAMLKEAGRGGCKGACQALQTEAERARQRLEVANKALVTAPSEKNRALLATTLGLPPALLEIVPALLFSTALNGLAFTLLAFGAHLPNQSGAAPPESPAEPQVSQSQGRAEQVRSFVEAYRKRHGRDPSFSDVRNSLGLPRSTTSVYLRKALA